MGYPVPGDVIGAKYHVDAVIGEGGFGIVYRASTQQSDRPVAIKLLKRQSGAKGATTTARFKREMRSIATLDAPETLTLFDFGETDDGLLFMVTEFVEGEDLADAVARHGTLSEGEALHVLLQVLYSLREAHARGLVHRDIKPRNIRVYRLGDDRLRVKVLDFGIAKSTNPESPKVTKTGHLVGTPRYMAPEQFLSDDVTPQSDIYALGLVTAEMIAGRHVLDRAGPNPVQRRVFLGPEDGVAPAVAAMVNRMAAPNLAERFRSVEEVIELVRPMRRGFQRAPRRVRRVVPEPTTAPDTSAAVAGAHGSSTWTPIAIGFAAAAIVVGAIALYLHKTVPAAPKQPAVVTPKPVKPKSHPEASEAFAEGVTAFEDGRWLEALKRFHTVGAAPESPEADQLRSGGLIDSAFEKLFLANHASGVQQALELFPDRHPLVSQMQSEQTAVQTLQQSQSWASDFSLWRVPRLDGHNVVKRAPAEMAKTLRFFGILDRCYDGKAKMVEAFIVVLTSGKVAHADVTTKGVPRRVRKCVEDALLTVRFKHYRNTAAEPVEIKVDGERYLVPFGTTRWHVHLWGEDLL